jgi:hypothetical protein
VRVCARVRVRACAWVGFLFLAVWLENGRIPIDLPAGSFDKLKLLQTQRAPGTRYRHLPSAICHLPSAIHLDLIVHCYPRWASRCGYAANRLTMGALRRGNARQCQCIGWTQPLAPRSSHPAPRTLLPAPCSLLLAPCIWLPTGFCHVDARFRCLTCLTTAQRPLELHSAEFPPTADSVDDPTAWAPMVKTID